MCNYDFLLYHYAKIHYFGCEMDIIHLLLIIVITLYFFVNLMLWKGIRSLYGGDSNELKNFSVIVAARNEERTIKNCITSILRQNYPLDKFEIIVVNDRSTDTTKNIIEELQKKNSTLQLINIETEISGMPAKKFALSRAIAQSKFDFLVFTDADCAVGKNWLNEFSKHFTEEVGVVAGYSPNNVSDIKNYFGKIFLHYEEFKNSLFAAAGIGLNNAFMCTGRNFAYKKKLYQQVGGFEKIKHSISGDDDLFIQLLQKETGCAMRYMTSPESFVRTFPPGTLKKFISQRTRHISASRYYPANIKFLYSILHVSNLISLIALCSMSLYGLLFFLVKTNIDAIGIVLAEKKFYENFSLTDFLFGEILFALYPLLLGPIGYFSKFTWKGAKSS